jgi:hypothetical protein
LVMAGVDLRTVQELMVHKTLAMTLRYAHLSPAHQLDAVQRLNREPTATTTATDAEPAKVARGGGAEVLTLPKETSGGALDRTGDLGIMSRRPGSQPSLRSCVLSSVGMRGCARRGILWRSTGIDGNRPPTGTCTGTATGSGRTGTSHAAEALKPLPRWEAPFRPYGPAPPGQPPRGCQQAAEAPRIRAHL